MRDTTLRTEHEKVGARLQEFFGCRLPASYGDPAGEASAARSSVSLFDANYLAAAYLDGPDRVRYLNAVTSGDVQGLQSGQGTIGLLLNPQGHILAEILTLALADRLLLLSHALVLQRTLVTLEKFIIMDDATLADASEDLGVVAIEGPAAPTLLTEICGVDLKSFSFHDHREAGIGELPCRLIRHSHFGQPGVLILTEQTHLSELWRVLAGAAKSHGGQPIGYEALNALRLEAGVPWFGYDFSDKAIPHEAGLEISHINYTKGCYTGQEIVERVRSRGHVNRRRVGLEFSGRDVPPAGEKLLAEDKEVGHVTSAAWSFALERVIGMGYVRREQTSAGTTLKWSGGTATVRNPS